jgi:hypothetical protein
LFFEDASHFHQPHKSNQAHKEAQASSKIKLPQECILFASTPDTPSKQIKKHPCLRIPIEHL